MNATDFAARAARAEAIRTVAELAKEIDRIAYELGVLSGYTRGRGLLSVGALGTLVKNARELVGDDKEEGPILAACGQGAKRAEVLEVLRRMEQVWAPLAPKEGDHAA